jgi:uncharacterized protein
VIEVYGRCGGWARKALAADTRPMGTLRGALLVAICCLGFAYLARADVPVPPLTSHVTDLTGTLTPPEAEGLDHTLQGFEARKGSQLALLIVPTTAPETIEQYGIRVADKWKLGRKNVDDGAILIIAKDDRAVRIEAGYGLEGVLTDETSGRIIREIITPHFREGDFYGGISAGIDQMIRVVDGEPLPPPPPERRAAGAGGQLRVLGPIFLVLILVVGPFMRTSMGRFPGAIVTGGVLGLLAWLFAGAIAVAVIAGLIGFFFTLLGGGMGGPMMGGAGLGGWGGGFGGGIGGGGFGGGGFSGGGGGFGGGGASGRW